MTDATQGTLFGGAPARAARPVKATEPPDFWNMVAARKLGEPGWRWWQIRAIGKPGSPNRDAILKGDVPVGFKTKGPNAGHPIWKGKGAEVYVSEVELNLARAGWERETGKCGHCGGDGQEVARWSAIEGPSFRDCRACDGTGKPATTEATA